SQNIALRLRSRLAEKRDAGEPHTGGYRPYGYRSDFVTVDQGEAEVIREAAGRLLAGETLREVTRDLNRRGLLSSTGKAWAPPPLGRPCPAPWPAPAWRACASTGATSPRPPARSAASPRWSAREPGNRSW